MIFLAYSGETRWRTRPGRAGRPARRADGTAEHVAQAWRTALDPAGDWMPQVLRAADPRLSQVRAGGMPDAGGLVIATDQTGGPGVREAAAGDHRRDGRRWCSPTTAAPRRGSPRSPSRTSAGWSRCGWCPRASTSPGSPSGCTRPARRPRCTSPRRSGGSCGPAGPGRRRRCSCPRCRRCCGWPARWRPQRDHVLGRRRERRGGRAGTTTCWRGRRRGGTSRATSDKEFNALGATAELDQVIFDGASFGTGATPGTPEEEEYLGLPGLLEPGPGGHAAARRGRPSRWPLQKKAPAAGRPRRSRRAGRRPRRAPRRAAPAAQRAGRRAPPPHRPAARQRSTPSCAGPAAGRRPRSARSSSSSSASPRSSPGRPAQSIFQCGTSRRGVHHREDHVLVGVDRCHAGARARAGHVGGGAQGGGVAGGRVEPGELADRRRSLPSTVSAGRGPADADVISSSTGTPLLTGFG